MLLQLSILISSVFNSTLLGVESLSEELGSHLGPYDGKAWADTVTRWHRHSMSSPAFGRGAGYSTDSLCSAAKTDMQSLVVRYWRTADL